MYSRRTIIRIPRGLGTIGVLLGEKEADGVDSDIHRVTTKGTRLVLEAAEEFRAPAVSTAALLDANLAWNFVMTSPVVRPHVVVDATPRPDGPCLVVKDRDVLHKTLTILTERMEGKAVLERIKARWPSVFRSTGPGAILLAMGPGSETTSLARLVYICALRPDVIDTLPPSDYPPAAVKAGDRCITCQHGTQNCVSWTHYTTLALEACGILSPDVLPDEDSPAWVASVFSVLRSSLWRQCAWSRNPRRCMFPAFSLVNSRQLLERYAGAIYTHRLALETVPEGVPLFGPSTDTKVPQRFDAVVDMSNLCGEPFEMSTTSPLISEARVKALPCITLPKHPGLWETVWLRAFSISSTLTDRREIHGLGCVIRELIFRAFQPKRHVVLKKKCCNGTQNCLNWLHWAVTIMTDGVLYEGKVTAGPDADLPRKIKKVRISL